MTMSLGGADCMVQKHAFSMWMDRGTDLSTLADTLASCSLRRDRGECGKEMCTLCPTKVRLMDCMEQLPACDRLFVENMARHQYGRMAYLGGPLWRGAGAVLKDVGRTTAAVIGMIAGFVAVSIVLVGAMFFILRPFM